MMPLSSSTDHALGGALAVFFLALRLVAFFFVLRLAAFIFSAFFLVFRLATLVILFPAKATNPLYQN